jgi:hypothetical protein
MLVSTSDENWGTSMTGDSAVLLVRLRAGVVGESRRMVHVVPFPVRETDDVLVAYCGLPIVPVLAEYLDGMRGMPCELCVARATGLKSAAAVLQPGACG